MAIPPVYVFIMSFHPRFCISLVSVLPALLLYVLLLSAVCHSFSLLCTNESRRLPYFFESRTAFELIYVRTLIFLPVPVCSKARDCKKYPWYLLCTTTEFSLALLGLFPCFVFDLCLFYRFRVQPSLWCTSAWVSLVLILDCLTTLTAHWICTAILLTSWFCINKWISIFIWVCVWVSDRSLWRMSLKALSPCTVS